jgi:cyclophilin family peptidyl-prolyl cis-trans isomerase
MAGWIAVVIVAVVLAVGGGLWFLTRAASGRRAGQASSALQERPADATSGLMARMQTSMGVLVLKLYEDRAPNTVDNFVHLASKGFYNGLKLHRVIADFMVQSGCPKGDGTGGPGWRIADEFAAGLKHDGAGVLSMANAGPNTGGSQFFITLGSAAWLDGKHAVFGRVVQGADVLKKIGAVKTDSEDRPLKLVTVEAIALFRDGKPLAGVQPAPKVL